jgi:hypothetical protein
MYMLRIIAEFFCFDEDEFKVTIYNRPVVMPYLPITRCESYTLPPLIAPVNKYFSKAGGPSANNTEKFRRFDHIFHNYICLFRSGNSLYNNMLRRKPIAITITSKPEPVLSITPICHDFKTGILTNSYVGDYRAPRYSFEWKKEDGTLVSSSWDFFNKSTWKLFIDCYRPIYFRLFIRSSCILQLRKYFHLHLSPYNGGLVY